MVRLKARCRNRLDFEHYFLRQKCFGWHTLLLQADFHNLSLRRFTEYCFILSASTSGILQDRPKYLGGSPLLSIWVRYRAMVEL